jgi:pyruvate-formate lyase
MTEICLQAAQYHFRPSIELKVRPDMPDKIWDLAMETLQTGCGQPAFYNEPGYLDALRTLLPGIREEDLIGWNGGGCTETMLHGCSNVGSLDAGINLPLILEGTLACMLVSDDVQFDQVLLAFKTDLHNTIHDVLNKLNGYFIARAQHRPQPVRSLLVDDCLERGLDFNAGGARYNWSVVNIAGLSNVVDSLQALRQVVFESQEITPSRMLSCLQRNFAGCEPLRLRLLDCAKFGNDQKQVDELAVEIARFTYEHLLSHPCQRGGRFLPAHIMFETFGYAGEQVGASPDGRLAFEPLADSVGPVQGRDRRGPTAMLNSVVRLPLHLAAGTPVLNMRFSKGGLAKAENRLRLRQLVETFFRMGGMQIQISILDRLELLDALEHPERHEDLIVRIGGYSTYFNLLSEDLKKEVIKRTEYLV